MRVVMAGEDEVGFQIIEALMNTHEIVFIYPEDRNLPRLEKLDINLVLGSPTSAEVLRSAGAERADAFIAAMVSDEMNIVACIAAQRLGAGRTICFLQRRGFFSISATDDVDLASSLGIDLIVRPAEQLSEEILKIVTIPGALDIRGFANGRVQMLKFEVDEGSPLLKGPLSELSLPLGILLVLGRRGDEYFIPQGNTVLSPGDKTTAVGTPADLRRLNQFLTKKRSSPKSRRAVVVGGGVVGLSVARGLSKAGWKVKIIESDHARCEELASQVECLVLHGDGTDLELLLQESVGTSAVLIAVTNNDERNLLVSLLAKHLGVPRIITRADRLINERIFDKVGIDVVLSAHGASIRWIVKELLGDELSEFAAIEHGKLHVIEMEIPSMFPGGSLRELQLPDGVIVVSILRNRNTIIPRGNSRIEPGDNLILFCTSERIKTAQEFFHRWTPKTNAPDEVEG